MVAAYDDLILDHIRNARNYRVPAAANRQVAGANPMCGDELVLYLEFDGDRIADIGYQCTCCGLSMASASIMTELVKGMSADEALAVLQQFSSQLGGAPAAEPAALDSGRRALLDASARFPSRARCVALPWGTLQSALSRTRHGML